MGNTDGSASGRSYAKVTTNLSAAEKAAVQGKKVAAGTDPSKIFYPVAKVGANGVVRAIVSLAEIQARPDLYDTSKMHTPVALNTKDSNGKTSTKLYTGYVKATTFQPINSVALPGNPASKHTQADPATYDWNLPPHQWSLPLQPAKVNGLLPNSTVYSNDNDMYRRGRIWFKASDPKLVVFDSNQKLVVADQANRNIGFQFLWNPDSISTSVAVQLDATPSASDRLIAVAGAFPATESLSINLRIDRTNDFACIYNRIGRTVTQTDAGKVTNISAPNNINPAKTSNHFVTVSDLMPFTSYYKTGFSANSSQVDIATKLVDLMERGTIADIEYLYSAINGVGAGGGTANAWTNSRGIRTADIGYLMPTLLNIDIGPLSYQGYVTNLTVTHTSFNKNMVPIRSDVTIALSLLATSGLNNNEVSTNSNTAGTSGSNTSSPGTAKTPKTQPRTYTSSNGTTY
jgi:hypothetical protein